MKKILGLAVVGGFIAWLLGKNKNKPNPWSDATDRI
jgi:hypothetical protein